MTAMVPTPRLRVKVPGDDYHRNLVSCQVGCPVGTDARAYVRAIAEGDEQRAYLIARGPNPLASICGRVCGARCEAACRRGSLDEPVAIRALKRYICERFGVEARVDGGRGLIDYLKRAAASIGHQQCQGCEELLPLLQSLAEGTVRRAEGMSVGIVGSGPAGLAAAHDLALLGFSVVLYEMEPVLGGMLAVGIPHYRLPRELIQAEIETIVALGVEPVTSCCVGRDVSLPELRARHDAMVLAVGAKRSRRPGYPGSDAEGVIGAVEFLRDAALGRPRLLGRRVVVVGGGDAAMDVARMALRLHASETDDAAQQGEQHLAMDVARTVWRMGGGEVHVVYRRTRGEMPAVKSEVEQADEEGVQFHFLCNPVRIEKDEHGRVRGVWCQRMELGEADASGRRRPVPVEGSEHFLACDSVLVAVGQTYDLSFVDPQRDGLRLTEDGRIECDPRRGTTTAPGVFVAGDLAHGTRLLIDAVASGKQVARSVYEYLTGRSLRPEATTAFWVLEDFRRERGYESLRRTPIPTLPPEHRLAQPDVVVESGYRQKEARREATRCLDCAVTPVFDSARCVLCGGCADVCPTRCLKLVALEQLEVDLPVDDLLEAISGPEGQPAEATAIIKDEDYCIRCGLCAARCPADAITMERVTGSVQWSCR